MQEDKSNNSKQRSSAVANNKAVDKKQSQNLSQKSKIQEQEQGWEQEGENEDTQGDGALLTSIRYLLVAIIAGVMSFYAGGAYKSKNMQISYISQGEILALEKERVRAQSIKDRQLFFGKPENAINHIEQIQKDMSKNGVITLLTESKIYGNNVTSISKEVHLQIIERLSEGEK